MDNPVARLVAYQRLLDNDNITTTFAGTATSTSFKRRRLYQEDCHAASIVPISGEADALRHAPNLGNLLSRKLHLQRAQVLVKVLNRWSVLEDRKYGHESLTLSFFVPGIGMILSPWASSQAIATCPGVALCFLPMAATASTSERILGKFSVEYLEMGGRTVRNLSRITQLESYLGMVLLKSSASKSSIDFYNYHQYGPWVSVNSTKRFITYVLTGQ